MKEGGPVGGPGARGSSEPVFGVTGWRAGQARPHEVFFTILRRLGGAGDNAERSETNWDQCCKTLWTANSGRRINNILLELLLLLRTPYLAGSWMYLPLFSCCSNCWSLTAWFLALCEFELKQICTRHQSQPCHDIQWRPELRKVKAVDIMGNGQRRLWTKLIFSESNLINTLRS